MPNRYRRTFDSHIGVYRFEIGKKLAARLKAGEGSTDRDHVVILRFPDLADSRVWLIPQEVVDESNDDAGIDRGDYCEIEFLAAGAGADIAQENCICDDYLRLP